MKNKELHTVTNDVIKDTVIRMKATYEKQVAKLKEDWNNGTSEHCKKSYRIQLSIWERRIKEYEEILNEGVVE